MITDNQLIEIIISNNAKFYQNLGYKNLKQGTKIFVPIHHLPKNSQKKIKCSCDKCGENFERQYQLLQKETILCYSCSKKSNGEKSGLKRKLPEIGPIKIDKHFNLKKWIEDNCIRKDGRIISHSTKIEWFEKNKTKIVYEEIIKRTNYLSDDCNFLQRYYDILNDNIEQKLCKICNSPAIFLNSAEGYSDYCSHKCSSKDKDLNSFRINKSKETIIEKFGVDNCSKIPEIKQKISEIAKQKSLIKELGVHKHLSDYQKWILNNPKEIYKLHVETETPITILSKQLGFGNSTLAGVLQKNGLTPKIFSGSFQQKMIFDWLLELGMNVEYNNRTKLNGKELDIFLPEQNIAIEVNGLYWHGETNKSGSDLQNHLLDKTELCILNDIELLHFYDCEIIEKLDIVKSIILNKLDLNPTKIFARKCIIKEIESKTAFEFYQHNHLQTPIYCKHNYGLYFNNELISCIGVSKSRTSSDYEIIRFCNKLNTSVIGGFSKLLNKIIQELNITNNLISFVDRRIFNGKSYTKKFELMKLTAPNFYYFNKNVYKLESRQKFQKHKLQSLHEKGKLSNLDPSLSTNNNLINNDYYRVYDCGNLLFRLKN